MCVEEPVIFSHDDGVVAQIRISVLFSANQYRVYKDLVKRDVIASTQ